jgi:PAS domain S-box-containing protein
VTDPGGHILIVEDSPTQAEMLRAHLTEAGFRVVVAGDGEEALSTLVGTAFDGVVTDVVMPGPVDGYELCRRIRRERRLDVPVVLLTTLGDPLDIIRGLEVGADHFLVKPCEPAELVERLRLLLATRQARRRRGRVDLGVKLVFLGREFTITSEREQILDLLIGTFEEAVNRNSRLQARERELEDTRRQLETRTESLESRLHAILESVPDVLFSMSADGREVHYVSAASRTVFGLAPEAFGTAAWENALHPADRDLALAARRDAVATGEGRSVEYRVRHGDGWRWVSETVVVVDEGGARRLDGIARDTTALRDAMDRLALSDRILGRVGNLVLVANGRGELEYVSPSVRELLGFEPHELLGDGWWERSHVDGGAPVAREYVAAVARGEAPPREGPYEAAARHRDGRIRWLLWHDTRGPGGTIVGVGEDVTDWRRTRDELQRRSAFLELSHAVAGAANEANDPVALLQLAVTEVCRRLGWAVGHAYLRERRPGFRFAPTAAWFVDDPDRRRPFREATDSWYFQPGEGLAGRVAAEGRAAWLPELAAEPGFARGAVAIAAGLVSGVVVPVKVGAETVGILEFFHPEAREPDPDQVQVLDQVGLHLGRAVERERADDALRQAQKMDAVGRLAGGIAHDFNNLLQVILGEAEIALLEAPSGGGPAQALERIRETGERAVALTGQLLAFSRQQVASMEVFALDELVRRMSGMLERLLGEGITLTTRLEPGAIQADWGQVEQVLVNLAVNARDAMPDGGTLDVATSVEAVDADFVRLHPGLKAGRYAVLAVSDTGGGIPPDVLDHIFEPFFTTKAPGKGTGLGLATCYGIVQRAGGHIAVQSREGVGTTVRAYWPVAGPAAEAGTAEPAPPPPSRGGETILLVEDELHVREVATRMLEVQGRPKPCGWCSRAASRSTSSSPTWSCRASRAATWWTPSGPGFPGCRHSSSPGTPTR